jgi:hypothetical protein
MASNPMMYNIDNKPLSVDNIINYLYYLNYHKIIPDFTFQFDSKMEEIMTITVIYSASTTIIPLSGYTIITYNIKTQKWKSSINLASIIDGRLVDKTFTNIQRNFPFVIDNNLLKINYEHPYVEYVIESNYIEDVLEPSLNTFISDHIDPYDIKPDPAMKNKMFWFFLLNKTFGDYVEFLVFTTNNSIYERYLEFLSKKNTINEKKFVPEELWDIIYKYYNFI